MAELNLPGQPMIVPELSKDTVHMRDPQRVQKVILALEHGGVQKLQVISDFDMTLSRFRHEGERCPTCYNIIDNSKIISEDCRKQLRDLYNFFYPLEIDPNLSNQKKDRHMVEWWSKAHSLLCEQKIQKQELERIAMESPARLREGFEIFFDTLHQSSIPLLIFSDGIGDVLEVIIRRDGAFHPNIKVVANYMDFNDEGILTGFQGELIHTYNKNSVQRAAEYFQLTSHRSNILLLGDTLGDPAMADGFKKKKNILKIGFLNDKINELEKAVSAAHTFLQKNPSHEMTLRYMNYYRTLLEVDEFLIDLEAQPFESIFVKAVKTYNGGDFRRSTEEMEQALPLYYKAYNDCLTACEGVYEMREFKDFYPAVADHLTDVLECKVECESNLTPNVGGYFVQKFVATMYHYLQFAYYKLNDVRNAVQCVSSYMLFDPSDTVMQQNLAYYKFYKEKWDLEDKDFNPREEALRYYNQTARHKDLLQFSKDFLQRDDDEAEVGAEEDSGPVPSDAEFEGEGDYEEGIYAEWWTEPKSKGDLAEKSTSP